MDSQLTVEFLWSARSEVEKTLRRLERRAAKLGVPFVYSISAQPTKQEPIYAHEGTPSERVIGFRDWGTVTTQVEPIRFDAWKLLGVLTPMPTESGDVVVFPTAVPGETLPADVRDWTMRCDHCQQIRRRNETFIVQHESGDVKQVGRQCIRDFLGHSAEMALQKYTFVRDLIGLESEFAGMGGGYVPSVWSLSYILTATSAVVRQFGWMSRKATMAIPDATASADRVRFFVESCPRSEKAAVTWREFWASVTDSDRNAADETVEYWKGNTQQTDYAMNCALLATHGLVIGKSLGLAVSMLPVAQQIGQRQREAAELTKHQAAVSKHVGTVGERIKSLTAKVTGHKPIDGNFGVTTLISFVDTHGNILKWFASESINVDEWPVDSDVTFKATVKKHDSYNGVAQTLLTRCVKI